MQNFGAALFTAADANSFVSTLTAAITDNLPAVIIVVAALAGIGFARQSINRAVKKGKV